MQTAAQPGLVSTKSLWIGRILSGLVIVLLLFDSGMKLVRAAPVLEAMPQLGWPVSLTVPLGVILLLCVIVYAIPQTSVLGAILLSGYLGGAVATHTRIADPLFSHILAPVYLGIVLWLGLYLREPRLRALVPIRG
jgi:hypothetical protein